MSLNADQELRLRNAFRPHAPIEDPASFVGRQEQLTRVREAIRADGLHVVLYGERGCGKTSLANVSTIDVRHLKVFCEENATFTTLLRDAALLFQATDPVRVKFDAVRDAILVEGVTLPANSLSGNMFLQLVRPTDTLCIVLDEIDRIRDKSVVGALAELTKNAATYCPKLTFIMVGADETADGLLAGHISNFRNLRQVPVTRMTGLELQQIVDRGQAILGVTFEPDVVRAMILMADQMPYYLHLLATNSAQAALERGVARIEAKDLRNGTVAAAKDVDHSLRETYQLGIVSQKGSSIYRRLVWAIAELDDTMCNVGTIYERANDIARSEGEHDVSPQALGAALKRLASPKKGSVVKQVATGVCRFRHPLMKGFVRLMRHHQ